MSLNQVNKLIGFLDIQRINVNFTIRVLLHIGIDFDFWPFVFEGRPGSPGCQCLSVTVSKVFETEYIT